MKRLTTLINWIQKSATFESTRRKTFEVVNISQVLLGKKLFSLHVADRRWKEVEIHSYRANLLYIVYLPPLIFHFSIFRDDDEQKKKKSCWFCHVWACLLSLSFTRRVIGPHESCFVCTLFRARELQIWNPFSTVKKNSSTTLDLNFFFLTRLYNELSITCLLFFFLLEITTRVGRITSLRKFVEKKNKSHSRKACKLGKAISKMETRKEGKGSCCWWLTTSRQGCNQVDFNFFFFYFLRKFSLWKKNMDDFNGERKQGLINYGNHVGE